MTASLHPRLLLGLAVIFTLCLTACGDDDDGPTGPGGCPAPSSPAPALSLQDTDGTTHDLASLRCDDVVLVEFWASWSAPSRQNLSAAQSVYDAFGSQGFQVLAVNVGEDASTADAFREEQALSFPVLLDPGGAAATAFGVVAPATRFLIDARGSVRTDLDFGNETELEAAVSALLAERDE